ncbi:aromatic ring-opening dioxygenase LigA [Mumia zhuanghuii]|uniref:Aromatic ring-opening dioxygenase LigA n=1 Tax=Mumia zhuanghuii TaxID=2585211 RepID=A0A5C4MJ96_9ACTN|nr:aromatic ring-opening dioxygenase LigA [Mumia zhuanghuii]TNC43227.1 aromatic ring-opening dioxygenase LigA [Mumia zhuanghuii]TNC45370.1 aromatic ring-opening dioxygenase LigA [Mumia zhuanghuii]
MRKTASIASILLGAIMIVAAIATWVVVSSTLSDQKIVVSDDADCAAGSTVAGPISAYCQAKVIDKHTLEATDGRTYAELDREDPLRETAMDSAFLQASLFTSVVAFGVAAMAAAMGVIFILIGLGIRDVSTRAASRTDATSTD